ncbi:MAG: hypothetical protein ACI9G9_000417 [Psychromonas sp.]|jgi:hypothetical protein
MGYIKYPIFFCQISFYYYLFFMKTILLLLSACFVARSYSQGLSFVGAESAAMAHTTLTDFNGFSPFHNPGLIAKKQGLAFGLHYQNLFSLQDLQTQAASLVSSNDKMGFSLSVSKYGRSSYQETQAALGFGLKLSPQLFVGIKADYFVLQLPEYYGKTENFSASLGLVYVLNEEWEFGSSFLNVNQDLLSDFKEDRMTPLLRMGAKFSPSSSTSIRAEVWKEPASQLALKLGADYRLASSFYLRGGVDIFQRQFAFGFGYRIKNWQMDISSQYHTRLGWSPVFSLSYSKLKP